MQYKIKRTLTGKRVVKYACERCGELLESPITEAGDRDTCPACNASFIVPGSVERQEFELELAQEAAAKLAEKQGEQKRLEEAKAKYALAAEQKQIAVRKAKEEQEKLAAHVLLNEAPVLPAVPVPSVPLTAPQRPQFRCPFCQSTAMPLNQSKTSTAGWVFFWLLLLFMCLPLCWIGLFIKDHYRVCRSCGMKLG